MHECLKENSPGAMEVARAVRDRKCMRYCDGRESSYCVRIQYKKGVSDLDKVTRWDGIVEDI